MTVSEIVNDLLKHNMITAEAALVLLRAESQTSINNVNMIPQSNQVFQPYHGNIANPFHVSANTTELSAGAKELINLK
jgi:hypothetical protein